MPVYFHSLTRVKFESDLETSILVKELESAGEVPPGSLHWNLKKDKSRIFVKCATSQGSSASDGGKYEWVQFSEITLFSYGKVKAADLIIKFMENKPYNSAKYPFFNFSFY
jgi:hypothetical protein